MKNVAQTPISISPPSGIFPVFNALNQDSPVLVEEHRLKSLPDPLGAIKVGEEGRGRWQSALLVSGCPIGQPLTAASIGETRSGSCKLLASNRPHTKSEHVILVVKLGMGYRGGNSARGEIIAKDESGSFTFEAMPAIVLAEGTIAEGAAGAMGSGGQWVFLLPAGKILRLGMSGRRPAPARYVWWSGEKLYVRTWEERIQACEVDGDPFPLPRKEAL